MRVSLVREVAGTEQRLGLFDGPDEAMAALDRAVAGWEARLMGSGAPGFAFPEEPWAQEWIGGQLVWEAPLTDGSSLILRPVTGPGEVSLLLCTNGTPTCPNTVRHAGESCSFHSPTAPLPHVGWWFNNNSIELAGGVLLADQIRIDKES